ncbi:stage III sporulation protein AF [Lihuaxuella thermophila]|uniref:Stage III sporulation protein AF n=1 Tax=Lihuaxuella thermophila TaxID=1173111 RepID=A0A1H8EVG4_9BACL|nr:stage III sporulation protein AF [Lihuaxuella thermophila]SEN22887.1 stage III sporulation protein AF [Lihuaxuella thermophila]
MNVIEWLGDWLKQIILLILIATFMDLLLPNHTMERYVKLVMGLLIILAILSPIFNLLQKDLNLSSLAFTTDRSTDAKTLAPIDQIKQNSEKLKTAQNTLIQEQTEQAMEQMIQEQIAQKFPVEVMETNVTTQMSPEHVTRIKQIRLVARMKDAHSPDSGDGMRSPQPIMPVHVNVGEEQPASTRTEKPSQQAGLVRSIIDDLKRTWNLSSEQIQVRLEPVL